MQENKTLITAKDVMLPTDNSNISYKSATVIKKTPISLILRLIEDENTIYVMDSGKCHGVITRDSLCEKGFIH